MLNASRFTMILTALSQHNTTLCVHEAFILYLLKVGMLLKFKLIFASFFLKQTVKVYKNSDPAIHLLHP